PRIGDGNRNEYRLNDIDSAKQDPFRSIASGDLLQHRPSDVAPSGAITLRHRGTEYRLVRYELTRHPDPLATLSRADERYLWGTAGLGGALSCGRLAGGEVPQRARHGVSIHCNEGRAML